MSPAARIQKLSDALGASLDRQKLLAARVAELEAIAGALASSLYAGGPVTQVAAWDAWQVYNENKRKKK